MFGDGASEAGRMAGAWIAARAHSVVVRSLPNAVCMQQMAAYGSAQLWTAKKAHS